MCCLSIWRTTWMFCCVIYMMASSGSCADYEMECDTGKIEIDTNHVWTGRVDTSKLGGGNCLFDEVTKVVFRMTNADEDICTVPYPECNQEHHKTNQNECWCESSSGNLNTYKLSIFFEERFDGDNLRITSNCASTGYEFTYTDCVDLERGLLLSEKLGIGLGVTAFLLVLAGAIVVGVYCYKKNRSGKQTSGNEGKPHENR
ncbi:uncharacterized protein LOC143277333 [Babylonia areolata]|uniref:uncharacterized protein LOC143277333 n=1 Tax=Babylonia areolata TaxID=304850 RepID=UPI003FD5ECE6